MIKVREFCELLKSYGFGPFTGVPCSILRPIINYLLDSSEITYYTASSEGEAMGIAAGAALARKRAVVIMQNSGLGNAINPLTSLQMIYEIPTLLLIGWRGEPGKPDAPQHRIMGPKTKKILERW